jgi:hypothetical protein
VTFQAYLDSIKKKTGMSPEDFRVVAGARGLLDPGTKVSAITEWLRTDYGLGPGHAMAIVGALGMQKGAGLSDDDRVAAQFAGAKAKWRTTFDELLQQVGGFGEVTVSPTNTYLSLLKDTRKFAVVAVTAHRLDVGLKLPGEAVTDRLQASGSWNAMMTHRVRIASDEELDDELLDLLRRAYEAA